LCLQKVVVRQLSLMQPYDVLNSKAVTVTVTVITVGCQIKESVSYSCPYSENTECFDCFHGTRKAHAGGPCAQVPGARI
jgi:hypothetical protein